MASDIKRILIKIIALKTFHGGDKKRSSNIDFWDNFQCFKAFSWHFKKILFSFSLELNYWYEVNILLVWEN